MPRKPKYRRHSSGKAFVEFKGRRNYLPGKYGSQESKSAYDKFLRAHVLQPHIPKRRDGAVYVAELMHAFASHAESYYGSSEAGHIYTIAELAVSQCGTMPVSDFGPIALKALRASLTSERLTRGYINHQIQRLVRAFKWGVEHELVPYHTYAALTTVRGLAFGKTSARESEPVQPVDWETVSAVFPHVAPTVEAMIRVHWHTGVRSQNICNLRPCEIDRSGDVWVWTPETHKNVWRGQQLTVFVGPQAQEVLGQFLERPPVEHCFSPAEAVRWHHTKRGTEKPSVSRRVRDCYDTHSYRQAIWNGLAKQAGLSRRGKPTTKELAESGVRPWTPHQLRHSRGDAVRQQYGIEAAQSTLGHESLSATQLYTLSRLQLARQVALETG